LGEIIRFCERYAGDGLVPVRLYPNAQKYLPLFVARLKTSQDLINGMVAILNAIHPDLAQAKATPAAAPSA